MLQSLCVNSKATSLCIPHGCPGQIYNICPLLVIFGERPFVACIEKLDGNF
jgi:hypothetical protein